MVQGGKVLVLRQAFHPGNGQGSADYEALPDAGLGWAPSCCLSSRSSHRLGQQPEEPRAFWASHRSTRGTTYVCDSCTRLFANRLCWKSAQKRGCDERRKGRVFPQEYKKLSCGMESKASGSARPSGVAKLGAGHLLRSSIFSGTPPAGGVHFVDFAKSRSPHPPWSAGEDAPPSLAGQ